MRQHSSIERIKKMQGVTSAACAINQTSVILNKTEELMNK